MDDLTQIEFPDGNPADQIRNITEYIHVLSNVGVERIVKDVVEEGYYGGYGIEKDDPGLLS